MQKNKNSHNSIQKPITKTVIDKPIVGGPIQTWNDQCQHLQRVSQSQSPMIDKHLRF